MGGYFQIMPRFKMIEQRMKSVIAKEAALAHRPVYRDRPFRPKEHGDAGRNLHAATGSGGAGGQGSSQQLSVCADHIADGEGINRRSL
jgi:hypothetical protein